MNSAECDEAIWMLKQTSGLSWVRRGLDLKLDKVYFSLSSYEGRAGGFGLVFVSKIELFSYDFVWGFEKRKSDIVSVSEHVVKNSIRFASLVNIVTDMFNGLSALGVHRVANISHDQCDETCRLFFTCTIDDGIEKSVFIEFMEDGKIHLYLDSRGSSCTELDSGDGYTIATRIYGQHQVSHDRCPLPEGRGPRLRASDLCVRMEGILESMKYL